MKNIVLLSCGIVLSMLFLVFSSSVFEVFYYEREFSNEMYNQGLYTVVAASTVAVAWSFAAIYYYAIDTVRFSRWYHWLLVMATAMFVAVSINTVYPESVFSGAGLDFSHRLFSFNIIDCVFVALMFLVASFSMRWWSKNCRHTPFPE